MNLTSILWLRLDLRLADNPALDAAVRRGGPVLPVFIGSPEEEGEWPPGGASKWWLHQSLAALDAHLRELGSRLTLRRGPALKALQTLVRESGATAVFWNRRYEPAILARDIALSESLRAAGLEAASFNAALLREPWAIQNRTGKPFQVFTPFWKHCLALPDPAQPLPAPKQLKAPLKWPKSLPLSALELEPKINWADGLRTAWQPGESGATANLRRFITQAFDQYTDLRNRPDLLGTSRLSPHLHFGEISPRQVWHSLRQRAGRRGWTDAHWRGSQFLAELGWREFAHHLLHHFPYTLTEPLRPEFKSFPWRTDTTSLRAWQQGVTGFPIVDAAMRELWATGWLHNRARMIVASFLVKDLLLPWTEGARWFWDTLVDADLAQNTLGWQWAAGCGADAAPYFRIFNPCLQGEKFDPQGDYVRRWCPELVNVPAKWIHRLHQAPLEILQRAGVVLGRNYPQPMVRHAIAREVALEAYARMKARR